LKTAKTLLSLCMILVILLSGCTSPKYRIDYEGMDFFYEDAKDAYRAGEKVEFWCTLELSDLDMAFYLDNEYLDADYESGKGYRICFVMPEHDVKLECRISGDGSTYVAP